MDKNNINSQILTVDKDNVTKKSMNEARNNRYNLLTKFCIKNNILHLFVAHHKDDNLETFLNRKIAGSDFYGLKSMSELSLYNKVGVIRPLLSRMLVPVGAGAAGEVLSGMDDDIDLDTIEVKEGESLEDIKAKLKPKKQAISAEMLDTANTYDDKVAVIRMIVQEESGRVSNVFKNMIQRDMN